MISEQPVLLPWWLFTHDSFEESLVEIQGHFRKELRCMEPRELGISHGRKPRGCGNVCSAQPPDASLGFCMPEGSLNT